MKLSFHIIIWPSFLQAVNENKAPETRYVILYALRAVVRFFNPHNKQTKKRNEGR
jgi:hypothetical protein